MYRIRSVIAGEAKQSGIKPRKLLLDRHGGGAASRWRLRTQSTRSRICHPRRHIWQMRRLHGHDCPRSRRRTVYL